MTRSLCNVSSFLLYSPAANIEFFWYISRDFFSRDLVSFLFLCFMLPWRLFNFKEIYFLQWPKYLSNNTGIVILYPCRKIIHCFTQESEYTTPVWFPRKKNPKTLHVSQNNKCFYGTHAMGLHCLMLILFHFSVPNIYLLSLKLDISSSIMIGKSFSSYIALCNYIIAICTDNTSILKTQLVLKSNDIQINAGPKKSSAIKFCLWNLSELAADDFVKVSLTLAFITVQNFDIVYLPESSACIDLIFSSNTSFVKNCGSELSIYDKCRHSIIYGTLNFHVPLLIRYYGEFKPFLKQNANKKWKILTDILLNIFKNFISHKTLKKLVIRLLIEWIDRLDYP